MLESSPARLAALRVLRQVRERQLPISDVIYGHLAELVVRLSPRDRSLMMEIVYGTLRWQQQLDWIVAMLAERQVADIQPTVLIILRMALYQLRFLDRIPESAAVNDAATLARESKLEGLVGFVNAILRASIRRRTELDRSLNEAPEWVRYSHPEWLWKRWATRFGEPALREIASANNLAPPTVLRCNFRKITARGLEERLKREGISVEPSPFLDGSFRLTSGDLFTSAAYREGLFYVQDEGSQLAAALAVGKGVKKILDLCSAPGGKSFLWAMDREVEVFACDSSLARMQVVQMRRLQYGLGNLYLTVCDAESAVPLDFIPDAVFVDAPCSGLGTIRRNPDIRWKISAEQLPRFQQRQLRILSEAARFRAAHLVYVTCSTEPEENEQVVELFVAQQRLYRRLFPTHVQLKRFVDSQGFFRTFPVDLSLDGFFGAVFRLAHS